MWATRNNKSGRSDTVAVSILVVFAAIIAWPLLAGGFPYYLDNPVHISEIHASAFEAGRGWSDVNWCGFPVDQLHSPLWYGALSVLARAGFSIEWLYATFVFLGFLAPAIALYSIARRRVDPFWAALPAWLLLCQYPSFIGVASALGGMWTFHFSVAFLALLIDRLGRRESSKISLSLVAMFTGLTLTTHIYAVVPIALAAIFYAWISLGSRMVWRGIAKNLSAMLLGVVAAAVYWGPIVAVGEITSIEPQTLSAAETFMRLVLPVDTLVLLFDHVRSFTALDVLRGVPMQLLVAAAIAGLFMLGRRRDDGPLIGATLAAALLSIVAFLAPEYVSRLLGPASWRLHGFVPVFLALASIPLLSFLGTRATRIPVGVVMISCVVAAVVSWWVAAPLRAEVVRPGAGALRDVHNVWEFLSADASNIEGRVYLQDTFRSHPGPDGMGRSHVLALTASRAGVRQLGSAYGVAPYATVKWTGSEFRTLFGRAVRSADDTTYVVLAARTANATHIVSSDSTTTAILKASSAFEALFTSGRFCVLRSREPPQWAETMAGNVSVDVLHFGAGRIVLTVSGAGTFLVKSTHHPSWRAGGSASPALSAHSSGLMQLSTRGPGDVVLEFRPLWWPRVVSTLAWLGIGALWSVGFLERRRRIRG